ncbi:hypothetical protein SCD75_09580 [Prescottella equi]|nr:hypothetical protein SCD75_09580 [Prescottella equi]
MVDPASEEGLRLTLEEQYTHIQRHDWAGMYGFSSPRCKLAVSEASAVATMEAAYQGRDFSGPQQYLITMNGSVATVVVKSFDGRGKMTPATWTFIDGRWQYDYC